MLTPMHTRIDGPSFELPPVDPWLVALWEMMPAPFKVWFFDEAFTMLVRQWFLDISAGSLQRQALLLRFGINRDGRVYSWQEVGDEMGGRAWQTVQEFAAKGLMNFWREFGLESGTNDELLPKALRVIADLTNEAGDMPEDLSIVPPGRDLYDPEYAESLGPLMDNGGRALPGGRAIRPDVLFPWRKEAE